MLSKLPDNANVWIFQADRLLNQPEIDHIQTELTTFVSQWSAHGASLKADFEIVNKLFVIIGVDESYAEASGCSKDVLTRAIKNIGDTNEIDFFDRLKIAYVNHEEKIDLVDMASFKDLVQKDIIRQDTKVFNNLITKKSELYTDWEIKMSDSWHGNLVPIQ